eukprot:c18126_g1_i1 orf=772-1788(+)
MCTKMGQATAASQQYARGRRQVHYLGQVHNFRDSNPVMAGEDSVDKLFYRNLVGMIPLVESFMQDQQTTKSFPRHASLVYTPTPSREAWPFKKAVDHSPKGKPGRGQLVPSKRGELKDSSLWDNAENMLHDDQNLYTEEIPMLPYPSNHRANRAAVPTSAENIQLRKKVQQLEQKLSEKECQLQVAEKTTQQIHLQLNATVERLQSQIQQKEQAIQNVQNQLFERQLEVVSLQSLVKKSEVNMQASSMRAAGLEEEFAGLRCQVGSLLLLIQSYISDFEEEPQRAVEEQQPAIEESVVEEPVSSTTSAILSMVNEMTSSTLHKLEEEQMASFELHSLE